MGSLCVELTDKIVEAGLLLQGICARRPGGFLLQGEVHALMVAILLRMAWFDALDGDAEPEPPHGQFGEVVVNSPEFSRHPRFSFPAAVRTRRATASRS